jgi:hypothetical protein
MNMIKGYLGYVQDTILGEANPKKDIHIMPKADEI